MWQFAVLPRSYFCFQPPAAKALEAAPAIRIAG
jgi:hypothetical protein